MRFGTCTAFGPPVALGPGVPREIRAGPGLGALFGAALAAGRGALVGEVVGDVVGACVGALVGAGLGWAVGASVGCCVGATVGAAVGAIVGRGVMRTDTSAAEGRAIGLWGRATSGDACGSGVGIGGALGTITLSSRGRGTNFCAAGITTADFGSFGGAFIATA